MIRDAAEAAFAWGEQGDSDADSHDCYGALLAAPALFAQNSTSTSTLPNLTAQTPAAPAHTAPTATHRRHHKTKKAPLPVVLPPMPSGPLRQLPMDQIPATPAKVSFEGGLLTIAAQNSTLE